MLFSRFWYFILALLATLGVAAALLTATLVDGQRRSEAEDDLRRDRFEVEQALKLEARTRIDAIAPIAANEEVRNALAQASARQAGSAVPAELTARLGNRLTQLNTQLRELRGDLVFAVDREGWIVAAIAPGTIPPNSGLGEFPLVARVLDGYVRDDVWVYQNDVYRMAARPVVQRGEYVGALIHGKKFDDELARRLSREYVSGATIGFFRDQNVFASYRPEDVQMAPGREDAAAPLANVLRDRRFVSGQRTEPRELPHGGLGVYSLVTGSARDAHVGYAIARPIVKLEDPVLLLLNAPSDSLKEMVMARWWLLAAVLLGGFFIAMISVWIERDRPLGKLRDGVSGLRGSAETRLTVTDFGGPQRKIAQAVNDALESALSAVGAVGPARKAANLEEILGPGGQGAPQQPAFFGFAPGQGGGRADLPDVPPARQTGAPMGSMPGMEPQPMGRPMPMAPPPPMGRPPAPIGGPPIGGPPVGGTAGGLGPPPGPPLGGPPAGGLPPMPPPGPPAMRQGPVSPPGPPPGPPNLRRALAATEIAPPAGQVPILTPPAAQAPVLSPPPANYATASEGESTAVSKQPGAQRKQLKRTLLGVPPPAEEDDDEGQTMVARVPEELIAQSSGAPGGADEEAAHFKEVYEKFVETKKQCGEPTAGLTFDKFVVTLRKNRDQIVSRHGARKVRFTVYVKNGKAALKATPIRE